MYKRISVFIFTVQCALFAVFASVAVPCHVSAQESAHLRGLPEVDGPVYVQIGFQLIDIVDVNEKEETVDFEGAIVLRWMDPRLAYDPAELGLPDNDFVPGVYSGVPAQLYQGDFQIKELFHGWRPHINLANGIGDRQTTNIALWIWPDGMVSNIEYFHARVETPMNLRKFPFDRQSVQIFFHPFLFQRSDVVLVPSDEITGFWQQDAGIADWTRLDVEMEESPMDYSFLSGKKNIYSELVITINISRRPGHILFSIIFPLLVLVSLTWCVFWMDEESISSRVNISFIGILSVVAYYFVILDSVPKIPYLTMMDAFMIATFMILALTVVISVVVDKLNRSGRKEIGDQVDRVCRWAFPLGYVVVTALIVFAFSRMS